MEFYFVAVFNALFDKKFQFPTGWNSTESDLSNFSYNIGFNSQRDGILPKHRRNFQVRSRFNSQRDGILRYLWKEWSSSTFVSIPNGMEFYLSGSAEALYEICFNSQRDGILPKCRKYRHQPPRFQFPTGWNSTLSRNQPVSRHISFQFPTGWNSTEGDTSSRSAHRTFQFPTGWNSTRCDKDLKNESRLFQFPTGWNSTRSHRTSSLPLW